MILTNNIINYNRTDAELEELILFLVFVAGKSANQTAIKLEAFLDGNNHRPFEYIRELLTANKLSPTLRKYRFGQYKRIELTLATLVTTAYSGHWIKTWSVEDLETIHGIGPKSARCFVSWTRPDVQYAMLDTHILKYLRDVLKVPNVPKSTPSGHKYLELEQIFLNHAKDLKRNPAELDLEIWKTYRI
jgi:thermostable 8-oxoguanine DNA glycosylase